MLRRDIEEMFFTYGYQPSNLIYASSKQPMPNVFTGTAFKFHFKEILEMRHREISSKTFFFLPSATDRKEPVDQYLNKVSLYPVLCLHTDFKSYSSSNILLTSKILIQLIQTYKEMNEKMLLKQCTLFSRKWLKSVTKS